MANPYIWAGLQRANNDPTTIDEAIGEAVAAHNDDPDAHLGPAQALESHRASEIIDHRAESVVNDKLRFNNRAYRAIVDPTSDTDYDSIQAAVDYTRANGGGNVLIMPGVHYVSSTVWLDDRITLLGLDADSTKIRNNGTLTALFGIASNTTRAVPPVSSLSTTNGSPTVTMTPFGYSPLTDFIGCGVRLNSGGTALAGYIQTVGSTTSATFSTNQTANRSNVTGYLSPYISLTSGSKTATILNGASLSKVGIFGGVTLQFTGSATQYVVEKVESDTVFTLSANWSGATSTQMCEPNQGTSGTVLLQNLDIANTGGSVFRDNIVGLSYGQTDTVEVTNGVLNASVAIFTGETGNYKMQNTSCTTPRFSDGTVNGNAYIDSCSIIISNATGSLGYITGVCIISSSKLQGTGSGGSTIFEAADGGFFMDRCLVFGKNGTQVYSSQGTISNCDIAVTSTNYFSLFGYHVRVIGNDINRFRINTGSEFVVAIGNLTDVAIVNNGTSSVLGNNGVY